MTRMTLEQRRAADAWQATEGCTSAYVRLAKSAPALIMNSGLMQTLAFLQDKNEDHHKTLSGQLRKWLAQRYPQVLGTGDPGYEPTMQALLHADPRTFQEVTAESLAWLRWVRQIAPTRTES